MARKVTKVGRAANSDPDSAPARPGREVPPAPALADDPPEVTARLWTRLGDGGRVVIPAEIRRQLGLEDGDPILLLIEDGELHLITAAQGIKRAQALFRQHLRPGESLVDELIADRRAEAARE